MTLPPRRQPLKRGAPPRRGKRPRARKPLAEDERVRRVAVREAVIRRDRVCILNPSTTNRTYIALLAAPHRCFGDRETMHHLKKSGQGGGYTFENLVLMCASGNEWVEDHPAEAHRMGLVKRSGDA